MLDLKMYITEEEAEELLISKLDIEYELKRMAEGSDCWDLDDYPYRTVFMAIQNYTEIDSISKINDIMAQLIARYYPDLSDLMEEEIQW